MFGFCDQWFHVIPIFVDVTPDFAFIFCPHLCRWAPSLLGDVPAIPQISFGQNLYSRFHL
jgi:hypothetical protein